MKKHSFVLRPSINALGSYPGGGGGGYPSYNSYKGMRRPTGSYFWDSDLKLSIIIKPFSRTGYNFSNARKLQNIIGDFNSKKGVLKICLFFRTGYHFGCKSLLKRGPHLEAWKAHTHPKPTRVPPRGAASAEGYVFFEQEVSNKTHFY